MPSDLVLPWTAIDEIFPFHVAFDRDGTIVGSGGALRRICPDAAPGAAISDVFLLRRPSLPLTFEVLRALPRSLIVLETVTGDLKLRGQLQPVGGGEALVFLGAPWISDLQDLARHGITLQDLPPHSAQAEMLFLLRANQVAAEDARALARQLADRQAALDTANASLHAVFETAAEGIVTMGADGKIRSFNAAAERIFGYTAREVVGQDVTLLMPPEVAAAHDGYVQRYLRTGHATVVGSTREVTGRHRDGSPIDLELAVSDASIGTERLFTGILRDLRERKRAQRTLEVQHAVLMALVEHSTVEAAIPRLLQAVCAAMEFEVGALWLVDAGAGVLRCAGTWARRPDAVAAFVTATTRRAFAPDEGLPGRVWSRAEPLSLQDVTVDGNFPRRDAAAACDLHGAFAFPVLGAGRVLGVLEGFSRVSGEPDATLRRAVQSVGREVGLALLRDAKERERAEFAGMLAAGEARLRGILDAALDCVITIDPEGRVIDFNAAAERTFGIPRDAIVHQPMAERIIPARFRDAHYRGLQHYLATGEGPVLHRRIEISALRHDGSEFPVELAITPVRLANGKQIFTAFLRDITERRRTEEALRGAQLAAEQASAAREQFLATMSHEIRTPLTAVIGLAHLLASSDLDDRQRSLVSRIRYSADVLLGLLNDVLDFAKISAGQLTLVEDTCLLPQLLRDAVSSQEGLAQERGLTLTLEADPALPTTVLTDQVRLTQVLLNLVSNAIKFTAEGGVTVRAAPAGGEVAGVVPVRIAVVDSGIGVAPEDRERIFDAFAQASPPGSRTTGGGTGLGLAIVRQLVELQGGTVTVESAVGSGSTFLVTIPFRVVRDAIPAASPAAAPQATCPLAGLHLLIVDDSEMGRFVAAQILEGAGAEVSTAADGAEAVAAMREARFDLVLMDLQMPLMDGYEATRTVHGELGIGNASPIAAMTASATPEERRRVEEAGMVDLILKPFRPEALVARVAAIARGRSPGASAEGAVPPPSPAPLIDRGILREQTLGQPAFARQVLAVFQREAADLLARMEGAVASGDAPAIAALAHRLKSQAGMLGAASLYRTMQALEADAKAGARAVGSFLAHAEAAISLGKSVVREAAMVEAELGEARALPDEA